MQIRYPENITLFAQLSILAKNSLKLSFFLFKCLTLDIMKDTFYLLIRNLLYFYNNVERINTGVKNKYASLVVYDVEEMLSQVFYLLPHISINIFTSHLYDVSFIIDNKTVAKNCLFAQSTTRSRYRNVWNEKVFVGETEEKEFTTCCSFGRNSTKFRNILHLRGGSMR